MSFASKENIFANHLSPLKSKAAKKTDVTSIKLREIIADSCTIAKDLHDVHDDEDDDLSKSTPKKRKVLASINPNVLQEKLEDDIRSGGTNTLAFSFSS